MKNIFLKKRIIIMCLAIIVISCKKKDSTVSPAPANLDITMNYSPNPAVKNQPIAFTFEVKQNGTYQAVTMTSCDVIMTGMNMPSTMAITEKTAGQYAGTKTFTESGNYELHFKYMNGSTDTEKDFTLTVK